MRVACSQSVCEPRSKSVANALIGGKSCYASGGEMHGSLSERSCFTLSFIFALLARSLQSCKPVEFGAESARHDYRLDRVANLLFRILAG